VTEFKEMTKNMVKSSLDENGEYIDNSPNFLQAKVLYDTIESLENV
jgi:hypothetical protein